MRKLVFIPAIATIGWALMAQEIPQGRPNVPGQNEFGDMEMMRATPPRKHKSKTARTGKEVSTRDHDTAPLPEDIPQIDSDFESPNGQSPALLSTKRLSPGEGLAACFSLLKLPPTFEEAYIKFPTNMSVLLVDPNAYLGRMAPFSGNASWSQSDGRTHSEALSSRGGYLVIRWPSKELGSPNPGLLNLRMSRPILAIQFFWSDFTQYGSDITKLLLQQVPNWEKSSRKLDILRSGYRETMFPPDLQSAIRDPVVGPILESFLAKSAPQLLHQLKGGGSQP